MRVDDTDGVTSIYDFTVAQPNAAPLPLWDLHGQVLLIVTLGREQRTTPQLQGVEQLAKAFGPKGLTVLAFPTPGFDQVAAPVSANALGVTFPVMTPVLDDGPQASPLFTWLSAELPGMFGTTAVPGYTKFLIGRDGAAIKRYEATAEARDLIAGIQAEIAAPIPPAPPKPQPPPVDPAFMEPVAQSGEPAEPMSPVIPPELGGDGTEPPAAAPTADATGVPTPEPAADTVGVPTEEPTAEPSDVVGVPLEPKAPLTFEQLQAEVGMTLDPPTKDESLGDIGRDVDEVGVDVQLIQEQARAKPPTSSA